MNGEPFWVVQALLKLLKDPSWLNRRILCYQRFPSIDFGNPILYGKSRSCNDALYMSLMCFCDSVSTIELAEERRTKISGQDSI